MIKLLTTLAILGFAGSAAGQGLQMGATGPDTARAVSDVVEAANRSFARLPPVRLTTQIGAVCGGGDASDLGRYCTSQNAIFIANDLEARIGPEAAAYVVAHLFGHAIQVRHGVADIALRTIRAEPQNEAELRGMVTRQVACLAGFLLKRADARRPALSAWFADEPFTDAHWGREPVHAGPRVAIGIAARSEWLETGYRAADVSACSVGRISADGLLAVQK
ncbi:neutral zinc metallopeptidase [Oceanibium sediminis]|uniref:neutral zinc metallopeptidase n=1 Tax=Oceanibium sediminis TaxID=2026339 RepID=UPI000DD39C3E|nr:neutral zinc metallopeptidase [Oceanibium sediminis]